MTPKPWPFQKKAINSVFKYFRDGNRGNPLVVAPTGSGKSMMIAFFCKEVAEKWPKRKILVISHVKEILSQNYIALNKVVKTGEIGLYSSGLNSRTIKNITIAGIQSIYNKPELFDNFDIIIVDEAHTIPPKKDGMYPKFFKQVKKPVIGFTATPFRLGQGYLHQGPDAFFDEIVYDIPIRYLQKHGYLCQISAKGTKKRLDAKNINKQGGDYILKELSIAFDREAITKDIISELLVYKSLRKKWLIFAIDIKHAENITAELKANGIKAACVHSKITGNRDTLIEGFKGDEYQALVSVAVLTTGFNVPAVDLIVLARPTASPVLHIQIIGRGLRIFDGKDDCLVLDFAGNLSRLGPIDSPDIKVKGKGSGEAIMKECPNCYEIVHAAVRVCPCCKHKFQFRHHLSKRADESEILAIEEWHPVDEVKYYNYEGSKGIKMLKVSYFCGVRRFNEYVLLEHTGYAKSKARHWWKRRSQEPPPRLSIQGVELSGTLKKPIEIFVSESGKFPEIQDHKFEESS